MLFEWLNTKDVDEFADSIAADLVSRFPPTDLEFQRRKGATRFKKAHELIFARAETFVQSHRLNIYTKARLGTRFKMALTEAGYSADFVNSVGYELTAFVALKALKRRKARS